MRMCEAVEKTRRRGRNRQDGFYLPLQQPGEEDAGSLFFKEPLKSHVCKEAIQSL